MSADEKVVRLHPGRLRTAVEVFQAFTEEGIEKVIVIGVGNSGIATRITGNLTVDEICLLGRILDMDIDALLKTTYG